MNIMRYMQLLISGRNLFKSEGGFAPIINLVAGLIIAVGFGVVLFLVQQRTHILPFAQQTGGTQCQAPATPTNVQINYPYCQNQQSCSFQQASCTWSQVVGATNYNVVITEVDSGSVIKNEQLPVTTTTEVFPIISGKTYKCDVTAANSCGSLSPTASQSLLCQIEGFASPSPSATLPPQGAPSPTPTPTPAPLATVAPIPVPTVAPAPVALACGYAPCDTVTAPCQAGLVCVTGNNGSKICANPNYQAACQATPDGPTCCTAPPAKPQPTQLPHAGTEELTFTVGIFSVTLVTLGALGMLLL